MFVLFPGWSLIVQVALVPSPTPASELLPCAQPRRALLSHPAPRSSVKFLARAFNQLLGWVLQFKEHQPGSEESNLPSPEPLQTSVWSWTFPRRGRVWSTAPGKAGMSALTPVLPQETTSLFDSDSGSQQATYVVIYMCIGWVKGNSTWDFF